MASNPQLFERDPITLISRRGMRVIGRLIEEWSLNPDRIPGDAKQEAGGRLIVIPVTTFHDLLSRQTGDDKLIHGAHPTDRDADYHVPDSILEVELVVRRPDRLPLLLPDPEALKFLHDKVGNNQMPAFKVATLYEDVSKPEQDKAFPIHLDHRDGSDPATYRIEISNENPLDAFLRPYLAAYCCTQCT